MNTFGLSFISTLALLPVARLILVRCGAMDVPNERSSHSVPVPRGAGIAVAIGTLTAVIIDRSELAFEVVAGSVLLGVLGLADDFHHLSAGIRFAVQVIISTGFCLTVEFSETAALLTFLGFVLWCVAYTNAFNFMDGINGMSALNALVAGGSMAVFSERLGDGAVVRLGLAIAGSSLAFLPFNAMRRLFLGDVGAYFVGFWIAASIILLHHEGVPIEVALAPTLPYLADTSWTIAARLRQHQPLARAHREHAYQGLVDRGLPHLAVSLTYGVASLACAVVMYLSSATTRTERLSIAGCAFALLVAVMARVRQAQDTAQNPLGSEQPS